MSSAVARSNAQRAFGILQSFVALQRGEAKILCLVTWLLGDSRSRWRHLFGLLDSMRCPWGKPWRSPFGMVIPHSTSASPKLAPKLALISSCTPAPPTKNKYIIMILQQPGFIHLQAYHNTKVEQPQNHLGTNTPDPCRSLSNVRPASKSSSFMSTSLPMPQQVHSLDFSDKTWTDILWF